MIKNHYIILSSFYAFTLLVFLCIDSFQVSGILILEIKLVPFYLKQVLCIIKYSVASGMRLFLSVLKGLGLDLLIVIKEYLIMQNPL